MEREPIQWWRSAGHGYQAEIPLHGGPAELGGRIVIRHVPGRWPGGSVSLIWGECRFGLDLSGPVHYDRRTKRIAPPHLQFTTEDGLEETVPVDCELEHIGSLEEAARWLVGKSGLEWHALWVDPPPAELALFDRG